MTAKEMLRLVHKCDAAVDTALKQLETLEADAERTTQIYGRLQVDGGQQTHGEALLRLLEAKRRCNELNDIYVNIKTLIVDRVNLLDDPNLREILTLCYIARGADGGPLRWDEIAYKMNYSERQCQRLHGDALAAFKKVMPTDEDVAKCREMSPSDVIQ